jgi:hypothetical protein
LYTKAFLTALFIAGCFFCFSQDSSKLDKGILLPSKLFSSLDKKSRDIQSKIDSKTDKYLNRLERKEKRLYKKLYKKDSLAAKLAFGNIDSAYGGMRSSNGVVGKFSNVYSGHLDTLTTALNFLKQQGISNQIDPQINLHSYETLQRKFNASEQIKKQLRERQATLKEAFGKVGMIKDIKGFQKDIYYYSTQIKEYKKLFEDPSKLEAKLVETVMKTGLFKDFFKSNSQLGQLFSLTGSNAGNTTTMANGLQTRTSVNRMIFDRFGSSVAADQAISNNVKAAQGQLSELKRKANTYSSGIYGNEDPGIPNFKPNTQKTRSFWNRLEYGCNIQSQKSRYYFPASTDIGLSLGYKINDNTSFGIGTSYRIGLGKGWDHIHLTHQGIGLRSYCEARLKGSFYVSGGYEQNYLQDFKTIQQLRDYSAWQSSGLIGLSKKYRFSKKVKGDMKLLWDFLSYRQVPRTQAILFRVGYSLK